MWFKMTTTREYNKYEKARLVGARALQIAHGAPIMVKTDLLDPIKIAIFEFDSGACPIDTLRLDVKPRE
jgi:DNA-directed RNA polymerase subunit K